MALINQYPIHLRTQKAADEAFAIQAKIDLASYVEDDLSLDIDERLKLAHTLTNYLDTTSDHLAKLKRRVNKLLSINRLPLELLRRILLFAHRSKHAAKHPYILYTWICRRWRQLLIHDPSFWTVIRFDSDNDAKNPFIYKLAQRSKTASLDVIMAPNFRNFEFYCKDFFALISNRIRRWWLPEFCTDEELEIFSDQRFPSLQCLSCLSFSVKWEDDKHISLLLPVLATSDHLETFQSVLLKTPLNLIRQLGSIFSRIRNLNLTISTFDDAQCVFALLDNSVTLQNVKLDLDYSNSSRLDTSHCMTLPEVQFLSTNDLFLLGNLRTPKLSSVNASLRSLTAYPTLEDLDVTSIKSLYVISINPAGPGNAEWGLAASYYIAGFKERVLSQRFPRKLSQHFQYLFYTDTFSVEDFLSTNYPRDCFCLQLFSRELLTEILSSIIQRTTGLLDIYSFDDLKEYENCRDVYFTKLLTLIPPSVERIVAEYGPSLLDFIRPLCNTALCPGLKYLSFVKYSPRREPPDPAEDVGKLLTDCIRARHEVYGNQLECVSLENCAAIPDNWLKELQKFGTMVLTD